MEQLEQELDWWRRDKTVAQIHKLCASLRIPLRISRMNLFHRFLFFFSLFFLTLTRDFFVRYTSRFNYRYNLILRYTRLEKNWN